jgi:hypothetical protein
MPQILLHKQKLSAEQLEKLASEGVIAIQTTEPADFQFLDLDVPRIALNDMVWACLDALNTDDSYSKDSRRQLIRNLALLATEQRTRSKKAGGPGPIPPALSSEP